MSNPHRTSRRSLLKAAGLTAVGGAAWMTGQTRAAARSLATVAPKKALAYTNEQFYGSDGKFDVEKGKDGIFQLIEYHGYPAFDGLRDDLWVSDYGLGQFTQLGLSAYMFMNQQETNYLQMDLFLLPNQMLPEHWHLKTENAAPKMEGWLCRHGRSYAYGEGERTKNMAAKIPSFETKWVSTFHETRIDPGQCAHVPRMTSRHWQFAGPEGGILTEVGTFHDNDGVRHSDPNIVFP